MLADGEPQIPERLEERADEALLARATSHPRRGSAGRCRSAGRAIACRSRRARKSTWPRRSARARFPRAAAPARRCGPSSGPARPARRAHAWPRRCIPDGRRRARCPATACSLRCVTRVLPIPIDSRPEVPWSNPAPEQVGRHSSATSRGKGLQGFPPRDRCAYRNPAVCTQRFTTILSGNFWRPTITSKARSRDARPRRSRGFAHQKTVDRTARRSGRRRSPTR